MLLAHTRKARLRECSPEPGPCAGRVSPAEQPSAGLAHLPGQPSGSHLMRHRKRSTHPATAATAVRDSAASCTHSYRRGCLRHLPFRPGPSTMPGLPSLYVPNWVGTRPNRRAFRERQRRASRNLPARQAPARPRATIRQGSPGSTRERAMCPAKRRDRTEPGPPAGTARSSAPPPSPHPPVPPLRPPRPPVPQRHLGPARRREELQVPAGTHAGEGARLGALRGREAFRVVAEDLFH